MRMDRAPYRVKLAETEDERLAAQRLRYRVFVEEMGAAASPEQRAARREWDAFDPFFDHLILISDAPVADPLDRVVGVYRLMTRAAARAGRGFYGATEYDLGPIEASPRESVELGRTCVAPEHRGGPAMHLMWNALAEYVLARDIEILFGAASFAGTDPEPYAEALSFLHHRHLAPPELRVRARPARRIEMDRLAPEAIDAERAVRGIPPLIKAYLRLGGVVGDGAWRDDAFNTIDVCLVMDTARMKAQRRAFYERNRSFG
ncbi:GNAT family N-acyltransferase [Amaricoccus sp.]|uniref:GNAT family N-acetyltransferase n=1 Tax=Amaricoccus sp. TaxID=1872485 RepID=UPI001B511BC0|nr:GNAT family N-acyltransferase [Amaricoccus sp.]MBP7242037.1 GNAT family N-acetyltransferase [Amaricoccus sp.]